MKAFAHLLALLSGCGVQSTCQPDPISGSPRCDDTSGGSVEAAATTIAAGGMYAAEGCKRNGCQAPFTCETVSQRCERVRCGQNSDCPAGFSCGASDQRCH
ncbi:MAG TPA: hypothetical protein VJR89_03325 [Polyangiales bacterium]|nr:hypothetical protein [Polyangiales bacterium]